MIVNLGDGVIAAMPEDAVDCCYSHKRPASPPLAFASRLVVLSLQRDAEKFYASQIAAGRSWGPHVFVRQK
jgi:hypothetical protein